VHSGDWTGLLADVGTPADAESEADLLAGMLRGWGLLGAGKASEALAEFERLARMDGVAPMVNYHLALARALVGDYEGAEALLADD
ncbi:hypothetical protein NL292_26040, partial [Klebsiella pneumoniae]|nr:hypothetical protein [Klebsiella pneumoniae]